MPERGDIWLANLDPQYGTESGKVRPVLVVPSQALLEAGHPSTLPLTTRLSDDAEPLRLRVPTTGRLTRDSDLLIDQASPQVTDGKGRRRHPLTSST